MTCGVENKKGRIPARENGNSPINQFNEPLGLPVAAAVVGISSNVRLVKLILIPIFANNLDYGRPPRWDAFRCARRISSK